MVTMRIYQLKINGSLRGKCKRFNNISIKINIYIMRHFNKHLINFLFLFVSSAVIFAQQTLPKNIDQFIENGRTDWQIPGMAVGVVKDGKVVYAQGFGEKQLGSDEKVDANTVFSIASVSKNITAAALAILVDRGTITWDDQITHHIPWFQMKDAYVTQQITLRDALTHQTGLGRILGNRLQFMTQSSRDEVLQRIRYMDLEKPFRSSYVYNNVMYSLAGQIIEYTDGRTWDDFLQQELFQPLEMTRTTTTLAALQKQDNIAYPHQEIEGKVVPINRRNWDNAGPAGGVNSTVNDLNQWMLMQLGTSGSLANKTIISAKQMNEIHKPQVITPSNNALNPQASYGLGWNILDYQGKRVWTHGGATDGFNTFMYLMPELELGIIVVTNTFNNFGSAVAYHLMDHYIGTSTRDWHQHYLTNYKNRYKQVQQLRDEVHNARNINTQPTLNTTSYTGNYLSDAYGKIEVKMKDKQLTIRLWNDSDMEGILEHWHYDTFRIVWKNKALREEFMQFHLDKDGKIDALNIEFVLRPMLLQVGAYPSNYTHTECFTKEK